LFVTTLGGLAGSRTTSGQPDATGVTVARPGSPCIPLACSTATAARGLSGRGVMAVGQQARALAAGKRLLRGSWPFCACCRALMVEGHWWAEQQVQGANKLCRRCVNKRNQPQGQLPVHSFDCLSRQKSAKRMIAETIWQFVIFFVHSLSVSLHVSLVHFLETIRVLLSIGRTT
jgi:hypothetical protein